MSAALLIVVAGLVPAIHVFASTRREALAKVRVRHARHPQRVITRSGG